MTTLTLEVDDDLLTRAERRAEGFGTNVKQLLEWDIKAFGEGVEIKSLEDILTWAENRGFWVAKPVPTREERLER